MMAGKITKSNPKYWLEQGLTEEQALEESKKYTGYTSIFHPNYYIFRGFLEEEAKILAKRASQEKGPTTENRLKRFNGDEKLYKEWIEENCVLSKKNLLKRMSLDQYTEHKRELGTRRNGKRPNDLEFWINQGYSEEDARKQVSENARKASKRCVEYWISRGYSEEDAVIKVSEHQNNTSLQSFIKRYGVDLGTDKYNDFVFLKKTMSKRSVEYWKILGYSEEESIQLVSNHQSEVSSKSPSQLKYWLDAGYDDVTAEQLRYEYCAKKFANTKFYWVDKGFSDEEAGYLVKTEQKSRGVRGALKRRHNFKSKLEHRFDKLTAHIEDKIWTSLVKRTNGKYFFPDFEFKNCFVEIYGDFWHGNPKLFGPEALIGYGQPAKEKWQQDADRIAEIEQITNKPVVVIWESDLNNIDHIKEVINEITSY